jgi:hypothetical protein
MGRRGNFGTYATVVSHHILTGKGSTFCAGMDLDEILRLREGIRDNGWISRLQVGTVDRVGQYRPVGIDKHQWLLPSGDVRFRPLSLTEQPAVPVILRAES